MIGNIDFHVKGMSGKKTLAKYKKTAKNKDNHKKYVIFL